MNRLFYKNAKIVIFVYDITNKKSFDDLKYWIEEVNNQISESHFIRAIIGNKMDLFENEEVNEDDLDNFANSLNAKYLKISAKNNENKKLIDFLTNLIIDYLDIGFVEDKGRISLSKNKIKKKKKCC